MDERHDLARLAVRQSLLTRHHRARQRTTRARIETPVASDNGTDATIWVECPAGKEIEVTTSFGVTVSVPTQTPTSGGVIYKNLANHTGGSAVEVVATSTGITYTCSPAFTCGLAGLGTEGNTGTYVGSVVVTGFEDLSSAVPLTPITEGAQIPISMS